MANDGDYHSLPRRKLQKLCKKHGIPANRTNKFMADALSKISKVINEEAEQEEGAGSGSEMHSDATEKITLESAPSDLQTVCDDDALDLVENAGSDDVSLVEMRSNPGVVTDTQRDSEHMDGCLRVVPDEEMSEAVPSVITYNASVCEDFKDGLSTNDSEQVGKDGKREGLQRNAVHVQNHPEADIAILEDDKTADNQVESTTPGEADNKNQPLKSRQWKEMLERATRKARHKAQYKELPFLKRTLANRSLERARLKRMEVLMQQRRKWLPTVKINETLRPFIGKVVTTSKESRQEQPVFGRKRFMEKAMAESAKKMSERKEAAGSPLQDISNQLDQSRTPSISSAAERKSSTLSSVHHRHQEQYKASLSGKSRQKTMLIASRMAAQQRNEILSSRRCMQMDMASYF